MLYAGGASPSLRVPASSASPNSNVTQTGRPPLWNPSSQRKVSRLYLYTTLSLQKIIEVVHAKSNAPAPGKDSANKKLNNLLDKEPRWLHPRTESDMGRRLDQLGASPTRTSPRPHSFSDPPPFSYSEADFKEELGNSPMTIDIPGTAEYGNRSPQGYQEPPVQSTSRHLSTQTEQDDGPLTNFIRQSTCLSSSTDRTNGTVARVLVGYSPPYIKAVGRLIKRYTAANIQGSPGMSPISEYAATGTWLDDDDAPPCLPNKPYHLPGDYLSLDLLMKDQPQCFPEEERHRSRACLCFSECDKHSSPWVTPSGPTYAGYQIIHFGSVGAHLRDRDAFENTVLHFVAARASIDVLLHAVASNQCDPILNARNTAGQTFLHLLPSTSAKDHNKLCQLLDLLIQKGFNIYAQDVYGRNFFHMMLLAEHSFPGDFHTYFDPSKYLKRDAFNVTPVSISEPIVTISRANTMMDLDPPQAPSRFAFFSTETRDAAIAEEFRLLKFVTEAHQNPHQEDAEGRNALQCLAMATLSMSSVLKKYNIPDPQMQANAKGKKPQEPKDLDSSTEKLKLRLELVQGLLDAGVDPNHYDESGHTPLMTFAAQLPEEDDYKYGPKILKALIDHHAQVNARSRNGETALHVAVRCGRKLAARTLFECGANVHVRDAAGRGLLDVADVKTSNLPFGEPKGYVHYEACRAWLSGKGYAVQNPSILQEWGLPRVA